MDVKNRTHRRSVEAANASMSPEQVRAAKCARRRNAHAASRKANKLYQEWAQARLTPEQQLQRLDWRLGKGVGAKRERAKLTAKIDKG